MKYPLAIINKLLDIYREDIIMGYDIGCKFSKTLFCSSIGHHAQQNHFRLIIPAFHRHSHNWGCQVQWHPMYMEGVGKKDFKGSKHLFSNSNGLASMTCLATPFHQTQVIEEFVLFWSEKNRVQESSPKTN